MQKETETKREREGGEHVVQQEPLHEGEDRGTGLALGKRSILREVERNIGRDG